MRENPTSPHPERPLKKHGDRLDDQIPRDPQRRDATRTDDEPDRREPREDDRSTPGG